MNLIFVNTDEKAEAKEELDRLGGLDRVDLVREFVDTMSVEEMKGIAYSHVYEEDMGYPDNELIEGIMESRYGGMW